MKFRKTTNILNWRIVLTHFIAIWLFSEATQAFFYLSDINFLQIIIDGKKKGLSAKEIINNKTAVSFSNFYYYASVGSILGFFIGILISLITTIRQKWMWVNTLIATMLTYILGWLGLNRSYFLGAIFKFPGIIIQKNTTLTIILDATILLALGIFAFFFCKLNNSLHANKTSAV